MTAVSCLCALNQLYVSRCVVHFTLRRGDKLTGAVLLEIVRINNNNNNQLYNMKCVIIPVINGVLAE